MEKNKRTLINVISSLSVLITNIVIGLWLSPFIVKNIGVEANGFVTLANNFIMYANLIVTALNSMAGRFITIEYIKKNYKKANLYYNSVFWGNLLVVVLLLIPSVFFILRLENIINIPIEIIMDVKLLFSFVFFNFFLGTGMPNWECGTYIANRLDRDYIPQMILSLFRCIFIFLTMMIWVPKVWYVGFASTIVTIFMLIIRCYNTHKLTPYLRIRLGHGEKICSTTAIKELVGAGIWNSISSVGNILLSGLDLIICNVFLGPTQMGILSLAKTLPNYMQQFSESIRNAFAPELMINYAEGNMEQVLKDITRSMKMTAVILIVPLTGIIVMSEDFFRLWVPSQNAKLLSDLSTIICLNYSITSGLQVLYNVFSVVNKVKTNAILMLLSGAISTIGVFILLNTTNLGLYAVAGVSVVVCFVRNHIYTFPYAAKYLGFKKTQFLPQEFMCLGSTILLTAIGTVVRSLFKITNWFEFLFLATIIGVVCMIVNILIFLNKEEKRLLSEKVLKRFGFFVPRFKSFL